MQLLNSGNIKEAIHITKDKGVKHVAKLEAKMLQLTLYARTKANNFIDNNRNEQTKLEKITIFLTIIGVFLSLVISFIAIRIVFRYEESLREKNEKLQKAIDEIDVLRGILPICSFCKNVRNDEGYYEKIEGYVSKHSSVDFSHTVYPTCMKEHYPEEYNSIVSMHESKTTTP